MLFDVTPALSRSGRFAGIPTRIAVLLVVLIAVSVYASAESPQEAEAKTALLIVDVQEFYFPDGAMPLENPEEASRNCKTLLKRFRDEDRTVIHIAHNASKGAAFHPDVTPREGEKVVVKDEVSAFNGTELLQFLQENQINRLVICGMQTHMCVEAAVRAAYDLGFECVLVRDACATRALTFGDHTIVASDVHDATLSALEGTYARVVDTETFLETP